MIAIVGGGQLGRMLALAARDMGLDVRCLTGAARDPAAACAEVVVGSWNDESALARLAAGASVATIETEHVPAAVLRWLAKQVPVRPSAHVLDTVQDRLRQKNFLNSFSIPTAPFLALNLASDVRLSARTLPFPWVMKTRRDGFDGRGQARVADQAAAERAFSELGGHDLIAESLLPLSTECSLLAARTANGQMAFWPLTENHHDHGILRLSLAPTPTLAAKFQSTAETWLARIATALDHVGVIAMECFVVGDRLLVNELAPRVHNSGHWTSEGAETSQFHQHLRAILDFPLGSTAARGVSAMVNLIGEEPARAEVLAVPGAHLHLYGKTPRPGRKLGHVTITAHDHAQLRERLDLLSACLHDKLPVPI